MTFGERLKEERKRLGMNQTEFALLGGIVKFTQLTYEKGDSTPNLDYLRKLHESGVDAYYILTGQRTPTPTSDQLLPFPQRLESMVKAEQLKGAGNGLLLRDLLAVAQRLALKLDD